MKLYKVLSKFVLKDTKPDYTEDMQGDRTVATLVDWSELLQKIRSDVVANGSFTQACGKSAFEKLATEKESEWHLAKDKKDWATSWSKRLNLVGPKLEMRYVVAPSLVEYMINRVRYILNKTKYK